MAIPKLPNDIIFRIIKESDGGLTEHKKKMSETLKNISLGPNCQCFCDGYPCLLGDWGEDHDGGLYTKEYDYDEPVEEFYHFLEEEERFNHIWSEHKGSLTCNTTRRMDKYRTVFFCTPKSRLIAFGFSQNEFDILFKATVPDEPEQQVKQPNPTEVEKPFDIWSCGC